ncbi:MAG: hypothetical protein EOM37_18265 [Proteobacteria bacterium]|nr:hypothetical protein [Pseudomonadota bacterium]
MKTLKVGKWRISGGCLSKEDSKGFADLYEGFSPMDKRTVKGEMKEIFACCFDKKKCTEQDIEDLGTIVGMFIDMGRECKRFESLEKQIMIEVHPDYGDPNRFTLCQISEWPISIQEIKFFGGLIEARCALSEIRGMALERWKTLHGIPFPYKSNLNNLNGRVS